MLNADIYVATDATESTEADTRTIARVLLSSGLEGAFIAPGAGMDGGVLERSFRVTISQYGLEADVFRARVRNASVGLRNVFAQDCVLVSWTEAEAECTHDFAPGATEAR